jgi:hypothetical protein
LGGHGVGQDLKFIDAKEPPVGHREAGECYADRGVRSDAFVTDGEFENGAKDTDDLSSRRCTRLARNLPGNWTHGDYVSAVAAAGDPAQIPLAAQSDCGKPMVAVGHGGGPPAHALANKAAGQAHAGGESDESGSGSGS